MILSMTGFAAAAFTQDELTATVQVRTVNSRFLDLVFRLPTDLRFLEEHLRARLAGRLTRGRVEADINIDVPGTGGGLFDINPARAEGLARTLAVLQDKWGMHVGLCLNDLIGPAGVLNLCAPQPDKARIIAAIDGALDQALDALVAMRRREGDAIADDLRRRLNGMARQMERIESLAKELPGLFYQKLQERLGMLTGGQVPVDPQRLAQEAAFLADRCDISEEIVRVRSHLRQLAGIMDADEPAGRKLNFLIQELNREFNTIGSKAGQAELAHLIVDLKAELEKIREQVQNVE
jgi:uncharacterized protein (TIGR00255 family)